MEVGEVIFRTSPNWTAPSWHPILTRSASEDRSCSHSVLARASGWYSWVFVQPGAVQLSRADYRLHGRIPGGFEVLDRHSLLIDDLTVNPPRLVRVIRSGGSDENQNCQQDCWGVHASIPIEVVEPIVSDLTLGAHIFASLCCNEI